MTHFDPLKPSDRQKFGFKNQDGGWPMAGKSTGHILKLIYSN